MTGADARRDEIGLRLFVAETRLIPDLAAHFLDDAVTGDGVTARRTDREDGLTECFEGLLPGDRGQLGGSARPRQRGEQLAAGGEGFVELRLEPPQQCGDGIGGNLKRGRYPDKSHSGKIAQMLRKVADELDA